MALKIKFNKDAKNANEGNKKFVMQIIARDAYFIGHCISYKFIEEELRKTHRRYIHGNGIPETNMYYPLMKYMFDNDIENLVIESIFESETDSGYEVLKEESLFLKEHYRKKGCLNKNKWPVVSSKVKSTTHPNAWLTLSEKGNIEQHLNRLWPERVQ